MEATVKVCVPNYYIGDDRPGEDHEEFIEVEKPVCCVTVYAVTRHYGGSEEGGWWYNWYEPVCSVPLLQPGSSEEIEEIRAFLRPRFQNEGDVYSVRGGTAYAFCDEYQSGENKSDRRPRYE